MPNLNQSIKGLLGTEVFFRDNEAVAKAKLSAYRHMHSGANRNLAAANSNDRNNKLIVSMNIQNCNNNNYSSSMASNNNNNNTINSYSNEATTPHASQSKI